MKHMMKIPAIAALAVCMLLCAPAYAAEADMPQTETYAVTETPAETEAQAEELETVQTEDGKTENTGEEYCPGEEAGLASAVEGQSLQPETAETAGQPEEQPATRSEETDTPAEEKTAPEEDGTAADAIQTDDSGSGTEERQESLSAETADAAKETEGTQYGQEQSPENISGTAEGRDSGQEEETAENVENETGTAETEAGPGAEETVKENAEASGTESAEIPDSSVQESTSGEDTVPETSSGDTSSGEAGIQETSVQDETVPETVSVVCVQAVTAETVSTKAGLASAAVVTTSESPKAMTLKVIDYDGKGYGDGQILISAGKKLLIDTYVKESWKNVNSWLKNHGYTTFDIYISHYHDDHMDNVTRILNDGAYKVSTLYLPDPDYMTGSSSYMKNYISMYKNMINTAKGKGVKVKFLKKGSSFSIGDVDVRVLWGTDYKNSNHETHYINNNSLVTRFTCGETRYLNAGDIEAVVERQILNAKIDIKADILKLNHHGGDTSNTEAFIKAVDPSFCYFNYMGDSPSKYSGSNNSTWATKSAKTAAKYANVASVRYNGDITYRVYDNVVTQELERNYTQQKVYIYDKKDKTELKGIVTQELNNRSRKYTAACAAKAAYVNASQRKTGTHADDGWLIGNGGLKYYVKNNVILKGWKKINGGLYHFNEKTGIKDTGWKTYGKYTFYFKGSGKAAVGFTKIGTKTYHFDSNGRQTKAGWRTINGKKYRFGTKNEVLYGMQRIGKKKYIFNKKTGVMITGPVVCDGKRYLCDKNGVVQQTYGWKTYGGKKYYVSIKNGCLLTGIRKINGRIYFFESGGALTSRTGFVKKGGKTYYICKGGTVKTGWLRVSGKLYFMDSSGAAVTGWLERGKNRYYLRADGTLLQDHGFKKIGGKTYFITKTGAVKKGWLKVDGKMYYMGSNGVMRTGVQKINGKKYRFSSDGVLL